MLLLRTLRWTMRDVNNFRDSSVRTPSLYRTAFSSRSGVSNEGFGWQPFYCQFTIGNRLRESDSRTRPHGDREGRCGGGREVLDGRERATRRTSQFPMPRLRGCFALSGACGVRPRGIRARRRRRLLSVVLLASNTKWHEALHLSF